MFYIALSWKGLKDCHFKYHSVGHVMLCCQQHVHDLQVEQPDLEYIQIDQSIKIVSRSFNLKPPN